MLMVLQLIGLLIASYVVVRMLDMAVTAHWAIKIVAVVEAAVAIFLAWALLEAPEMNGRLLPPFGPGLNW